MQLDTMCNSAGYIHAQPGACHDDHQGVLSRAHQDAWWLAKCVASAVASPQQVLQSFWLLLTACVRCCLLVAAVLCLLSRCHPCQDCTSGCCHPLHCLQSPLHLCLLLHPGHQPLCTRPHYPCDPYPVPLAHSLSCCQNPSAQGLSKGHCCGVACAYFGPICVACLGQVRLQ